LIIILINVGLFNMIYVHPVGGLGNMMFHIASIYALARDNNDELGLLNIDKKIYDLDNDVRWNSKHAEKYRYIFNRFQNKNGNAAGIMNYPFQHVSLKYNNEHEYVGYFQCEEYFKHRRNEILELFKPLDEFNIEKYSYLFGNISLHIRRTDFVHLYNQTHTVQSLEYYHKALKLLPNDLKVLVFSDDITWCKENFVGDRYVFIDEVDYISIYLMSKMNHHIIANSSFSWWGAWMCEFQNKKIIAPKNWFGGKKTGMDIMMNIIPNNWIRI